jgi:hypothetical protein
MLDLTEAGLRFGRTTFGAAVTCLAKGHGSFE